MTRNLLRTPARRATALLCGLAAALASPVAAQRLPIRTVPTPIDFTTSQNDNLYSLVRSQEDIHELETALEEFAAGDDEAAVARLHELLRKDARGVVPVAPGRFLGLRNAVVTVMANLSPKARDAYEQLVGREAGSLAEAPLQRCSPAQLELLATRFPTARRGLDARILLGDRALEAGDGLTATAHYREALDAAPIASREERRIAERLACAQVLMEPATARAAADDDRLGGGPREVLRVLPERADLVAAIGGGRSGRTPMSEPIGSPRPCWHEEITAPGFELRDKGELAMYPVGDLDGLFLASGREVIALDPLRRSVQWISLSPLRDLGGYSGYDNGDAAINQDMVLAAAVGDDVVVAALQVPDNTQTVDFQNSIRVMSKIPQRRLFAFARQSGNLLWAHFDELDGPRTRRFRGHDACGPPLIAGDTVYTPVHDRSGAIAFSVAAYDLATGKPKWRQLVCSSQQDVNMFGNARTEFASSPLALCDGVLYGTSNLGVAFALDAADGRMRWISAYDVVRMPKAMLHNQAERQVYFANNAPAVAEGVVCMTPLDSQFALGIDVDSGTTLWRLPYDARIDGIENRVQWLAGALGDEFVLSGAGAVAVLARPQGNFGTQPVVRQLVRPDQLGERRRSQSPGRPAVTATHLWLSGSDRLLAFDRTGEPAQQLSSVPLEGYRPGNLMLVDGIIVSLRQRSFDLVLDPQALLEQSERRVQDGGDEPAALLRLAHLRAALLPPEADGKATAAVRDLLRRGLAACVARGLPPKHPTRLALQTELYDRAVADAEAAPPQDAARRFAEARDLAADDAGWLSMQTRVLAAVRSDRNRFLEELERLERHSPGGRLPQPLDLPVPMFVLWQRALARDDQPKQSVAMWQELLEQYGEVMIGDDPAALLAEQAIAQLIQRHGAPVYADIAARALTALGAAGSDVVALSAVARRFPNSAAAERASMLLLDRAVDDGDLAVAIGVLAQAIRGGELTPGVLRRVQVAANRRGNLALGAAMARRLAAFADTASDWPADKGRDFAAAAAAAQPPHATPPNTQALPAGVAFVIPPRSQQEYVRLLPMLVAEGFQTPVDVPLYVVAGRDLVAYDLDADATPRKPLFTLPVDFLEHALLCGDTLLVPDMERVVAVHYRTGEPRWSLEFEASRLIDSLGLTAGVLQLSVQASVPEGNSDLIGVEPLTGARLFQRTLSETQMRPKPTAGQLVMLDLRDDGPVAVRIDPIDGQVIGEVSCARATGPGGLDLRLDSLATRLYPQRISADTERLYLPIDGRDNAAAPQLVALAMDGTERWRWTGTTGSELLMAQVRGSHFVVAERSEQRSCRAVLLDAATGAVQREVDLGVGALALNWTWSWLDNPAPPAVAFESMLDRTGQQRQLVVFAVDDGPSFVVPLAPDDDQIEPTPLFTGDSILFAVRPRRDIGPLKVYGLDLATRRGAFPGGDKYLRINSRGRAHGVAGAGRYTVVSTTQGLLVLGPEGTERR